ncbi:stromal interaction molecule homolog isoform X1 [Artemia franciscana]|uniref:stromal interaction molecule homolog isoform X1 n=1 Tax=Artemia franciscana TaxID=6661 RepID=UPI0032DA2432
MVMEKKILLLAPFILSLLKCDEICNETDNLENFREKNSPGDVVKPCVRCSYKGLIPEHEWLAFEAVFDLHKQLDDDADGSIDLEESEEFLTEELQFVGNKEGRLQRFHGKKTLISVEDFWNSWMTSAAHNWTTEEIIDWMDYHINLPQYRDGFISNGINGTLLPRLANKEPALHQLLGIVNPIHKRKVSIKAMEVVLFGPPREYITGKNIKFIVSGVVMLFATLALISYRQIRMSKAKLQKVMKDLDRLANAEQAFMRLQAEHEVLSNKQYPDDGMLRSESQEGSNLEDEMKQLRKENELLCSRLKEIECKTSWKTPIDLAHWLQLTYEIETVAFNKKRQQAEMQLAAARRACDQLKKKRSNLVLAFISTHGNGLEDVDGSITQARNVLMEVTRDLRERTCRWKNIEKICGISIIENPGLNYLRFVLKNETRPLQASESGSDLNITFPETEPSLLNHISEVPQLESTFSTPVREQSVLDFPKARDAPPRPEPAPRYSSMEIDGFRPRTSSANSKLFYVGDQEQEDKKIIPSVMRTESTALISPRMDGIPEKPEKEDSVSNASGQMSNISHNSTMSLASGDLKSRKNPKFLRLLSSFRKRKKKMETVTAS